MTPNHFDEDDSDYEPEEQTDHSLYVMRWEIVRLQAQVDQLSATQRDRAAEYAALKAELASLEQSLAVLDRRWRREQQIWHFLFPTMGAIIGASATYLMMM